MDLLRARVAPKERRIEEGIFTLAGSTQPFLVERSWSGPAGNYNEEWSIRRGREVFFRHPPRSIKVWGMQAVSRFEDSVDDPIELEEGTYQLVFVVEGRYMGSVEIEVIPASEAAA